MFVVHQTTRLNKVHIPTPPKPKSLNGLCIFPTMLWICSENLRRSRIKNVKCSATNGKTRTGFLHNGTDRQWETAHHTHGLWNSAKGTTFVFATCTPYVTITIWKHIYQILKHINKYISLQNNLLCANTKEVVFILLNRCLQDYHKFFYFNKNLIRGKQVI